VDYQKVKASELLRILDAISKDNPKLAQDILSGVTDQPMDWFRGFATHKPDHPVVSSGGQFRAEMEFGLGGEDAARSYFKAAGFDALDTGRDVRKLTGTGIRLKDAAFDPKKAASKNILAANRGAFPVVPTYPTED
jgi:hypothetical protein